MAAPCPHCSYENPLGANFCSSCGGNLEEAVPAMATQLLDIAAEKPVSGTLPEAMLVVRQGVKRGSQIVLDSACTTIGRHPESDIFLDDVTVSRRHAEIRRDRSGFTVYDVGSLNGTYVNQTRVEQASLDDGCVLQVGKFKLVFVGLEDDE